MAKGISINIGVNKLDENHYTGYRPLVSCIRDAQNMADIVNEFEVILLDKPSITKAEIIKEKINYAAEKLVEGDTLLVTFSGHGSQIKAKNGIEPSGFNQTWCLYDRQMIDDELAQLWTRFRSGVRIFFISDSCHSGTVLTTMDSKGIVIEKAYNEKPDSLNSFNESDSDEFDLNSGRGRIRSLQDWLADKVIETHYEDTYKPIIVKLQQEINDKGVKSFNQLIEASVISISACQDDQEAKDGDDNGVFTAALKEVWNNGSFQGNYSEFYKVICEKTKFTQNPKQNPKYVSINGSNFEQLRPFKI